MTNILHRWDITMEELSDAILANGSLRGMVFGYVAEIKLRNLLNASGRIESALKDDDHDRKRKGDLRIVYRGNEFKVECKSLQTAQNRQLSDGTFQGGAQVDGSDRRTVLLPDSSEVVTTNLLVGQFDVLAVNCFTFKDEWHFVFAKNIDLPRSTHRAYTEYQRQHLLATMVRVTWPASGLLTEDIFEVLDALVEEREKGTAPDVATVEEPISSGIALDPKPMTVAPKADHV